MSCRNEGGVLGAFVLGALIGAAAGLLLAPEKGKVTRDKIKDWAGDKWDEGREEFEHLKADVEKKVARKKKQLGRKLGKIKEEITERVLDSEK